MFSNFKGLILCLAFLVYNGCFSFMAFCNKTLERSGRDHNVAVVTCCQGLSVSQRFDQFYVIYRRVLFSFFFFASSVSQSKYTLSFCLTSVCLGKNKDVSSLKLLWECSSTSFGLNERPRETWILLPLHFIFLYLQIIMMTLPLHPCFTFINIIYFPSKGDNF